MEWWALWNDLGGESASSDRGDGFRESEFGLSGDDMNPFVWIGGNSITLLAINLF